MATKQKLTSKGHALTIPHPEPSTIDDVMDELDKISSTLEEILTELQAIRAGK